MSTAKVSPTFHLPARAPWGLRHFVSGASALADLRGLSRFSVPLGVSLAELSPAAEADLLRAACIPLQTVFIDSGAFSEVEIRGGRPVVVAPIDDATWRLRLAAALRIAEAYGARAMVVAPDRVGDQAETLARLRGYRPEIAAIARAGAAIVIPLQRGALSLATFDVAAGEAAGLTTFTRGITSNKDATPLVELEGYLAARRPGAVHLLGIGPRSPRLQSILDVFRRLSPATELSADSNMLAALVGHSNGRGGGPRTLTEWQGYFATEPDPERARENAVAMVFGPPRLLYLVMDDMVARGRMLPPSAPPLQVGLFDRRNV